MEQQTCKNSQHSSTQPLLPTVSESEIHTQLRLFISGPNRQCHRDFPYKCTPLLQEMAGHNVKAHLSPGGRAVYKAFGQKKSAEVSCHLHRGQEAQPRCCLPRLFHPTKKTLGTVQGFEITQTLALQAEELIWASKPPGLMGWRPLQVPRKGNIPFVPTTLPGNIRSPLKRKERGIRALDRCWHHLNLTLRCPSPTPASLWGSTP